MELYSNCKTFSILFLCVERKKKWKKLFCTLPKIMPFFAPNFLNLLSQIVEDSYFNRYFCYEPHKHPK